MRSLIISTLLTLHLAALPAMAGPWLKERGTGFVELSFGATAAQDYAGSLYFEYGATAQTTVGLDLGVTTDAMDDRLGYGTVFMRRALGPTDRPNKWAYELGIGVLRNDGATTPTLKTGLTWGRGLDWRGKSGWATVDGAVVWDLASDSHVTKLDSTVGLNLTDVMAAMLQINYARQDGDGLGHIEPSIVIQPKSDKFRVKIGAKAPLEDISDTALTLGLWHNF